MTLFVHLRHPFATTQEILPEFLQFWTKYDWTLPVRVAEDFWTQVQGENLVNLSRNARSSSPMTVVTITYPHTNVMSRVTIETKSRITIALKAAAENFERNLFENLVLTHKHINTRKRKADKAKKQERKLNPH